jgi:succinate dehydrogenase / fumarate reductase membrane anchor subunit
MSLRTPLARARGLGSAKEGVSHWWWQRVTAIALVPLSLWLAIAVASTAGAEHAVVVAWIGSPVVATGLIMLTVTLLYHTVLGMQVVVEDYVHHEGVKLGMLVAFKLAATVLGIMAVLSILRIAV